MGPCDTPLEVGKALDGEGCGWGYCEGAAGLGSTAELLVKGWVASGSKEERTELDMAVVGVRICACAEAGGWLCRGASSTQRGKGCGEE